MSVNLGRVSTNPDEVPPLSRAVVENVLLAVEREVDNQDLAARRLKFGGTHVLPGGPDFARLPILVEELGEVARELNEQLIANGPGVPRPENLLVELVQLAACCVAWAAAIQEGRP